MSFLLTTFFFLFFFRVSKERTQRLKVSKNKMTNKSVLSGFIYHYLQFFLLTFCTSPSILLLQLHFCLFFLSMQTQPNSPIHFFLLLLPIRNLMFPSLLPIYSKKKKNKTNLRDFSFLPGKIFTSQCSSQYIVHLLFFSLTIFL